MDEGCYQWRHYQVLRVIAKAIRTRVFFQQCCFYQGWGEDATRHKPYRGFWEQHRTDSLRSTWGHHSKATLRPDMVLMSNFQAGGPGGRECPLGKLDGRSAWGESGQLRDGRPIVTPLILVAEVFPTCHSTRPSSCWGSEEYIATWGIHQVHHLYSWGGIKLNMRQRS